MCDICFNFDENDPDKTLDEISSEIGKNGGYEHFKPLLDQLLGTTMEPRNEDAEAAYERFKKQ